MTASTSPTALQLAVASGRADDVRRVARTTDLLERDLAGALDDAMRRGDDVGSRAVRAALLRELARRHHVRLARRLVTAHGSRLAPARAWLELRAGYTPDAPLPSPARALINAAMAWNRPAVERARRVAQSNGWGELASLLGVLAAVADDDVAGARAALDVARFRSRVLADLARGIVETTEGDPAAADLLLSAHATMVDGGDELGAMLAALFAIRALLMGGRVEDAVGLAARPLAGRGVSALFAMLQVMLARVHVSAGHVDAAVVVVRAVLDAPDLTPAVRAAALRVQGFATALAGDAGRARAIFDEALAAAEDDRAGLAEAQLDAGEAAALIGDTGRAIALLEPSLAHYRERGRVYFVGRAACALAAALQGRGEPGDLEVCLRYLQEAEAIARTRGYPQVASRAAIVRHVLAEDGGVREWPALDPEPRSDRLLGLLRRSNQPAPVDLVIDVAAGELRAPTREAARACPREVLCALVALTAVNGAAVPIEAIHLAIHPSREFHPLRHRSTVLSTIARARRALASLFPERAIIEATPAGFRFARGFAARVEG